jgi:hypothetical protein
MLSVCINKLARDASLVSKCSTLISRCLFISTSSEQISKDSVKWDGLQVLVFVTLFDLTIQMNGVHMAFKDTIFATLFNVGPFNVGPLFFERYNENILRFSYQFTEVG